MAERTAAARLIQSRPEKSDPFRHSVIVEFDQHTVRVADENLPDGSAGDFARPEREPFRLKTLFHGPEIAACESDVMDNAGIRLLWFGGRRDVDEVNHRLALAVEPSARKREIWSIPVRQTENLLVKPYRLGKFAGPDIEMIEHPNAHARSLVRPGNDVLFHSNAF